MVSIQSVEQVISNGAFFDTLVKAREDSNELKKCIEEVVEKLLKCDTNVEKPGMLLGKIQSGKTRAFIGVIALAFDNSYDMAIILTKGTKALARQTYERLRGDFRTFVKNDLIKICDIMHLPKNFTQFELKQKLVIVVKKETNNLKRVMKALQETYPDLQRRKLLIIDDEADLASIGFRLNRADGHVEMNRIARQIDELRGKVLSYSFLQVTATPYSLYLQPEDLKIPKNEYLFKPVRPAFTVLLSSFDGYIGGEFYFEESADLVSPASCLFEEVPWEELEVLKAEDRRSFKIEEVLTSVRIAVLRRAIMNFIVGACMRRLQQKKSGFDQQKYSFIIHTEHSRTSHSWQEKVILKFKERLQEAIRSNSKLLDQLINESCQDLMKSIRCVPNSPSLEYDEVRRAVYDAIGNDYLMITKVNSESDEEQLLDDYGQLFLRTPLNLFIGGQILDRGLTIENLIGFYYGRRPKKTQQDTVLQHSRMYGRRLLEDMAVTRFYTARRIYEVMRCIHEFDSGLREAFELGAQDKGVVFIHKDPRSGIIPCSPNKILVSTITTLKPFKRLLPYGFQTKAKTQIAPFIKRLDDYIFERVLRDKLHDPFFITLDAAERIIDEIYQTLEFEQGYEWDIGAFKAGLEYLSKNTSHEDYKGKVWCLVRMDRNLSRIKKEDGSFSNAPDTPKDESTVAKEVAINSPMLLLIRQNGKEEQGWRDSPFWWPVLVAQKNIGTVIFSSELLEVSPDAL